MVNIQLNVPRPDVNLELKAGRDAPPSPTIVVDDELSETSTNPVQNRVITSALDGKYEKPSTGIPASDMSEAVRNSLYPLNYELIADITLTEDTDDFIINKFPDNSPLLITDFIMECDFKASPSTSYLGAIFKDSNGVTQYMPTGQMLTDSDKTAYYWTERYGSLVRMYANRPYGWDATTYDQPYYYNILYDSPTIREVNLYKYSESSQPIPAGSRIRLWGVRA